MAIRTRKPWSKVSLHRHLLSLLDRPTTTLKLRSKRNGYAGDCVFDDCFPPAYVRIEIDANNNKTTQFVMHELIHVIISEIVLGKFDATLEEAFLLGLERFMWDYISSKPARLAKWDKLIQKKLAESTPADDVPLADLVERPPEK